VKVTNKPKNHSGLIAHKLEVQNTRIPVSQNYSIEESYRELPFLESDFAIWMDQLENKLLEIPHWGDLMNYQGISLFDAAYAPLYWGFLDAFRKTYRPEYLSAKNNEGADDVVSRSRAVYHRFRQGELSIHEVPEIAWTRLVNQIKMRFPPQRIPSLPQQKRVLVLRAFPNRSAFPILPALKTQGATILFASWNDKLQKPVRKLGIPYINIQGFYRRKYKSAFTAHTKAITEMLTNVDPSLPSQLLGESSQYELKWNAFELFKENFTKTRVFIDLYLDLLEQYKPETVVLFNEISPPGRTMARVAKLQNIPSVAVQHGLFIGYIYRALTTDKIIVWGELPRKFWLERGCKSEQVVSVGAIAHEHWIKRPAVSPLDSKRKNQSSVLIIGQNPAAFISFPIHHKTVEVIMQILAQLPEVKFIIKPHPGEDPSPYQTEIKKYKLYNVELITRGTIEQFLRDANLVITLFSTVGAEAMFMGIPVIVVNLSEQPPLAPYASICPVATDGHSLLGFIKRVLNDPNYRKTLVENGKKFAHDYFGSTDGQSAHRATNLIMKTMNSNSRE
jgi:glycosyltransferase involved in cell wall biosynthesis